jgi:UDP-N-acetylmuramoyl-L-alanyl-D-glutamate--2,6-diaminopimelate ligase
MELVAQTPNGAAIYVDYAHTPDALRSLLNALRPHTMGKLSIVFGCGGERDRGKRPQMGLIAANLADRIYVSDDNPRSENAFSIRAEILKSCPNAIEVGDRAEAINLAINDLCPDDILVIAGRGHETSQVIGDRSLPFIDGAVARKVISSIRGRFP